MAERANLKLNELLEIADNRLTGGTLIIRDIEDVKSVFITGDKSIEKIQIHVAKIKIILSGGDDNNVKVIELKKPGTELGLKNVNKNCMIVVNQRATISQLALSDYTALAEPLRINTAELAKLKNQIEGEK